MNAADEFFRETSVVILNYNRSTETRKTVDLLHRHDISWREVIVCDNASADGSATAIQKEYPDVRLLTLPENVGVSGSNRGFEAATGKWILSLDDDSHPLLPTLAEHAEVIRDAPLDVAAVALSVRSNGPAAPRSTTELRLAPGFSGAGVLFRREALAQIGGYDPDIFLFTNELDWTSRAQLAGYRICRADGAVVIHRASPLGRTSFRHAYYYTRNTFRWLMRYAPAEIRTAAIQSFLRDILTHSVLHRTRTYLRAVTDLRKSLPVWTPLSEEDFQFLRPDLRAGFAYLG